MAFTHEGALHVALLEIDEHHAVDLGYEVKADFPFLAPVGVGLGHVNPRSPVLLVFRSVVALQEWDAYTDAAPVLWVFCVLDNAPQGVMTNRMDVGVEVGRVADGGCDATEDVAILFVLGEHMLHLGNEYLLLLHLALLQHGIATDVVVLDGELGTYLHLRAVGFARIDQHIGPASLFTCVNAFLEYRVLQRAFVAHALGRGVRLQGNVVHHLEHLRLVLLARGGKGSIVQRVTCIFYVFTGVGHGIGRIVISIRHIAEQHVIGL